MTAFETHIRNPPTPWGHQACGNLVSPPVVLPLWTCLDYPRGGTSTPSSPGASFLRPFLGGFYFETFYFETYFETFDEYFFWKKKIFFFWKKKIFFFFQKKTRSTGTRWGGGQAEDLILMSEPLHARGMFGEQLRIIGNHLKTIKYEPTTQPLWPGPGPLAQGVWLAHI